jgi:hypothetical protein
MATPSKEQIAEIRDWVGEGDCPTDHDIRETFDRKGNVNQTIMALLRRQLSNLLSDPTQHSLAGEVSENWSKNVDAKRADISEITKLIAAEQAAATGDVASDVPVAVVTGRLTRADLPPRPDC